MIPKSGYRFSRTNDFVCPEIMRQTKRMIGKKVSPQIREA